jgi:hypothetical protein
MLLLHLIRQSTPTGNPALFSFVFHPDADGQADDDGADYNDEEDQVLHGCSVRLRLRRCRLRD